MGNKIDSIQVLGSGCPTCKKLYELTKEAVKELGISVEVEYVTDIQKIIEMGVMSSPVLAINGKPVIAGQLPSLERLKEVISADAKIADKKITGGCSCGGNC